MLFRSPIAEPSIEPKYAPVTAPVLVWYCDDAQLLMSIAAAIIAVKFFFIEVYFLFLLMAGLSCLQSVVVTSLIFSFSERLKGAPLYLLPLFLV